MFGIIYFVIAYFMLAGGNSYGPVGLQEIFAEQIIIG
jgi:hypothetical protein